ncbi:MAG: hypothetical protein FWE95_03350 [Planctomycetaceae bacterium]|nr:hypothetical protein [Planctomycetaceae bacterium]
MLHIFWFLGKSNHKPSGRSVALRSRLALIRNLQIESIRPSGARYLAQGKRYSAPPWVTKSP